MYKILSFDGGGIFGAVSVKILSKLLQDKPDLIEKADLITGTSVGGIIATALAAGVPVDELEEFFLQHGPTIFKKRWLRQIAWFLGWRAKYSNKNLKSVLAGILGDKTMGELPKKVMVPAFALDFINMPQQFLFANPSEPSWRVKFFHNFRVNSADAATLASDVAVYTSAAPTYFPVSDGLVDGGMACNNPALSAVCLTQDRSLPIDNRPKLEDIVVLSIGMEKVGQYLSGKNADRGWIRWAIPILHIFLDNDNAVTSYQCDAILGNRHIRIQPNLPSCLDLGMDAGYKVKDLMDYASTLDVSAYNRRLEELWR